jgi:hypothetical protein
MVMCALSAQHFAASQSNDVLLFQEGRVALDKYRDCPTALKAFSSVPDNSPVRTDPIFAHYMYRTYDCLGDIDNALKWFQVFAERVPQSAETINTLADLRYRKTKADELSAAAAVKSAAAAEAAKRASAELSRNFAAVRADANAAGPVQYPTEGWRGTFSVSPDSTCAHFEMTALSRWVGAPGMDSATSEDNSTFFLDLTKIAGPWDEPRIHFRTITDTFSTVEVEGTVVIWREWQQSNGNPSRRTDVGPKPGTGFYLAGVHVSLMKHFFDDFSKLVSSCKASDLSPASSSTPASLTGDLVFRPSSAESRKTRAPN